MPPIVKELTVAGLQIVLIKLIIDLDLIIVLEDQFVLELKVEDRGKIGLVLLLDLLILLVVLIIVLGSHLA